MKNFYEKEDMIETLVDSDRSRKAIKILNDAIKGLPSKELRFLELGCGTGEFLDRVASLDERLRVWGIDISKLAIDKVKEKGFDGFALDVSQQELPFREGFFDVVYLGDVIEHLLDPDFMISEVKRILKKGGLVVLTTPNLASWCNRILLLFGFQPLFSEVSTKKIFGRSGSKIVGHLRLYTLKSLKEFLSYYGFKIISVEGAYFHVFDPLLMSIDKFFSHFPSLSSIDVVVALSKKD